MDICQWFCGSAGELTVERNKCRLQGIILVVRVYITRLRNSQV